VPPEHSGKQQEGMILNFWKDASSLIKIAQKTKATEVAFV
jgi:hypothetical protein